MKRLVFFVAIVLLIFTAASASWYVSKLHSTNKESAFKKMPSAVSELVFKEKINSVAEKAK